MPGRPVWWLARYEACGIIAPMHEMSVSQSILDIALRHADRAAAQRIVSINLVIGDRVDVSTSG